MPPRRARRRGRFLRALRRADRSLGVEARLRRRLTRRAPHLRLGARGERVAARALRRAGYRVVARNYRPGRPPAPELDVVAWEGDTLAVVEVKTRRGGLGRPMERVDEEKRRRLRRAAALLWRRESARRRIPPGSKLRLDVVEVWFPAARPSLRSPRSSPAGLRRRLAQAFERPVVRIRRGAV